MSTFFDNINSLSFAYSEDILEKQILLMESVKNFCNEAFGTDSAKDSIDRVFFKEIYYI